MTAKGRRLRILVADQVVLPRTLGPLQGELTPELQLEPLTESTLRKLAPNLSPQTLAAAEGRPLYALLGDDPAKAIVTRAHRRLEAAKRRGGEGAQRLLALAALAGPTANRNLRAVRHADLSLLGFLRGGTAQHLARVLPALKPARFADAVLLQYAEERTEEACAISWRKHLLPTLTAVEVELRVSSGPLPICTGTQSETRAAMQAQFDGAEPTRCSSYPRGGQRLHQRHRAKTAARRRRKTQFESFRGSSRSALHLCGETAL